MSRGAPPVLTLLQAAPSHNTETPEEAARLEEAAVLLWPQSHYLRREWLRAVRVVRSTPGGWIFERQQERIRA